MTKNITVACLLTLVLLGTGCVTRYSETGRFENAKMSSSGSALIVVPKDGFYGKDTYTGSGLMTARAVQAAFYAHLTRVEILEGDLKDDMAFARANTDNYTYLIEPLILHWEDRATEWSGLPDQIQIGIKVFDAATHQPIAGTMIEGASSWWTLGGDHPQDLLRKPLSDYAGSLFR